MRAPLLILVIASAIFAVASSSALGGDPAMRFEFPACKGLLSIQPRGRTGMLPVLSARAQQQNLQKKAFDVIGDIAGGAYHSTKNFWMAAIAGGFAGTVSRLRPLHRIHR